ncbi:hypothetical protein CEXT_718101 [Caerostris extrusa]|uniref:Uncharacterized protein n=1 Tax=Caerostris extrusa TaxID=172846 RepID=A0AAV4XT28_CAEEX|nr:hypothetical protein CEXT_718101 [Caerostris extrusa]
MIPSARTATCCSTSSFPHHAQLQNGEVLPCGGVCCGVFPLPFVLCSADPAHPMSRGLGERSLQAATPSDS